MKDQTETDGVPSPDAEDARIETFRAESIVANLLAHPHIADSETYTELALAAHNALFELYQRVGAEAFGYDYTPPSAPVTLEEWKQFRDRQIEAVQDGLRAAGACEKAAEEPSDAA